ncbi:MAG: class I SAM-dependent methyltransferase [Subdoligranulum sp.]|nr:methyltransferase domain-containing protein [Subdoligranulum sp.]MDD7266479.1 class I SAM-dependent methyltransferase [Subdoligranulum sp.]
MNVIRQENCFLLQKESHTIARCTIQPGPGGILLTALSVDPCWQRRGYGSYLLKEVLRSTGGFVPGQASLHWLYATDAPAAFFARFGFVLKGDRLVRRRPEELTAVKFAQSILAGRIPAGGFAIDATCGNGHDTEFLCRTVGPAGRVLALDIQPAAIASTRARLEQGRFENFSLHCTDHSRLAELAAPESADAVLFNFGWLPGADHSVYSGPGSTIPALEAALGILKPGGVLSAVLYSGRVIGDTEKQAVLTWLRSLPLADYTVLVCDFANWADTAPLPCLVFKK